MTATARAAARSGPGRRPGPTPPGRAFDAFPLSIRPAFGRTYVTRDPGGCHPGPTGGPYDQRTGYYPCRPAGFAAAREPSPLPSRSPTSVARHASRARRGTGIRLGRSRVAWTACFSRAPSRSSSASGMWGSTGIGEPPRGDRGRLPERRTKRGVGARVSVAMRMRCPARTTVSSRPNPVADRQDRPVRSVECGLQPRGVVRPDSRGRPRTATTAAPCDRAG